MIFNFNIFSLFIVVILVFVYFSGKNTGKNNSVFRYIVFVNYLIVFFYLVSYILICVNNDYSFLLSKLYMCSLIIYNIFLIYYIISNIISNKYKVVNSVCDKKNKLYSYICLISCFVIIMILLLLPINIVDNSIIGMGVNYFYFVILIFNCISLFLLFSKHNYIAKFRDLFFVCIINCISFLLQYYFNDYSIFDYSYVIVTLYMYLALENNSYDEIERLKIENSNAYRSNIDSIKFLTNMSYEIRTPLNAIDGLSQVIEDCNDIESIKSDVKDIRVASKNLIDIIDGIIDIAYIDNGKMEIVNENYDVYEMFDNVSNIIKSKLKNNNVELKIDISRNIPSTLIGDAVRIEQILLNLLDNAVKYTEKGYILLKVDVINSSSLCRLKMTVSDTGIGIKDEDIKNIFDMSNNKDSKSKNRLGLVIVKKLVELMGGKIDVHSVYKKGTTFVITIDQKVASILDDNKEVNKKKKLDIIDASGMRVMVVDDNKLNLKVAGKLLAPYNIDVVSVMSGQECLDILENDTNFDLILMDDMMPNMSGSETLDVILKLERVDGYNIPIVVLTANATRGMRDKYLKIGFDDYLAKPIDKYEINRVIRKFFKDKK